MSRRRSSPTSSSDETLEDKLIRATTREVLRNTAALQQRPPSPPQPGCCPSTPSSLVRGLSRKVFGTGTGSSSRNSRTQSQRTLPRPRSPPPGQASSDVTGTSGSAPGVAARTGGEEEAKPEPEQAASSSGVAARTGDEEEDKPEQEQAATASGVAARTGGEEEGKPEQEQAALTRSDYGAMMRSTLANIQEDGEGQEQVLFAKMEEAMTGLIELAYGKAELPNPPELPREFATRWPHDDGDLSHSGVMDDPVILASGYGSAYLQTFIG